MSFTSLLLRDEVKKYMLKDETTASLWIEMMSAKQAFPTNENLFAQVHCKYLEWECIRHKMRMKGKPHAEDNIEFYMACIKLAVVALRAAEEGDIADYTAYIPPNGDDLDRSN